MSLSSTSSDQGHSLAQILTIMMLEGSFKQLFSIARLKSHVFGDDEVVVWYESIGLKEPINLPFMSALPNLCE